MNSSPFSCSVVAAEMHKRVREARKQFESLKSIFMPSDLAQLVEERLAELTSEIQLFSAMTTKENDADRQGRLYKSISWGLSNLMTRTPWPPDRHQQAREGGKRTRDSVTEMLEREALSNRIAKIDAGPGRPSRDRMVVLRLNQLPPPDAMWDISFCKLVSSLSSFDLMVRETGFEPNELEMEMFDSVSCLTY